MTKLLSQIDPSVNIVGMIAIVALLSPPVTALIDNLFKLLFKCLEFRHIVYNNEYNHKRDLFEEFLNYTGQRTYDSDEDTVKKLIHAYYVLIPYIPQDKSKYFRDYCNLIQESDDDSIDKAAELLRNEIVPCIKKQLRRRRPLRN